MRAGIFGVVLVCLGLVACDSAPNPEFEKQAAEQKAAKAGDPYQSLNSVPQTSQYVRVEAGLRAAAAGQMALSLAANYRSMLKKLAADPKIPAATEPVAGCTPVFAEALAFQSSKQADASTLKATATALFDRLNACRERAVAAEKNGGEPGQAASLVKRFASTGMVLVGVATLSQGDDTSGFEMWSQADRLVAQDKPGFQLTPNAFKAR